MLQILGWLNKRNFNSDVWSAVDDHFSDDPVDIAVVHVRDLDEGGDLGVSGATVHPDHVSHPTVAAVITRCSAFPLALAAERQ